MYVQGCSDRIFPLRNRRWHCRIWGHLLHTPVEQQKLPLKRQANIRSEPRCTNYSSRELYPNSAALEELVNIGNWSLTLDLSTTQTQITAVGLAAQRALRLSPHRCSLLLQTIRRRRGVHQDHHRGPAPRVTETVLAGFSKRVLLLLIVKAGILQFWFWLGGMCDKLFVLRVLTLILIQHWWTESLKNAKKYSLPVKMELRW